MQASLPDWNRISKFYNYVPISFANIRRRTFVSLTFHQHFRNFHKDVLNIIQYMFFFLIYPKFCTTTISKSLSLQEQKLVDKIAKKHGNDLQAIDDRSLTICSGTDYINIIYQHVICPDAATAKVSNQHTLDNIHILPKNVSHVHHAQLTEIHTYLNTLRNIKLFTLR